MQTGSLAVWPYHPIRQQGVNIDCVSALHVHIALTVQLKQTYRNEVVGIHQLVPRIVEDLWRDAVCEQE
jgi:transposase